MMKIKQLLLVAAAALCFAGVSGIANAQDDGDEGHIFAVATLQWPFSNLDEIFALMEETQELVEQNEFILSRKVLRGNELFETKYPDEKEREARGEKFTALVGNGMHVDSIVRENPALSK
jgi:hypothetical protein